MEASCLFLCFVRFAYILALHYMRSDEPPVRCGRDALGALVNELHPARCCIVGQ